MKTLLLAFALVLTSTALLANPIKGKKGSKKPAAKTFVCQVIEMKGEGNQVSYIATFSETNSIDNNFVVFADAKVVEQNKTVADVAAYTNELKEKYNGIKILGSVKRN